MRGHGAERILEGMECVGTVLSCALNQLIESTLRHGT